MSSKEAHRNFGEDLFFFFGDHLFLTEKTARISQKTFFLRSDHTLDKTAVHRKCNIFQTLPEMQHISAGPGPTFGSRRLCLSANRGTLVVFIAQTVYALHHSKYIAICSIDVMDDDFDRLNLFCFFFISKLTICQVVLFFFHTHENSNREI